MDDLTCIEVTGFPPKLPPHPVLLIHWSGDHVQYLVLSPGGVSGNNETTKNKGRTFQNLHRLSGRLELSRGELLRAKLQ